MEVGKIVTEKDREMTQQAMLQSIVAGYVVKSLADGVASGRIGRDLAILDFGISRGIAEHLDEVESSRRTREAIAREASANIAPVRGGDAAGLPPGPPNPPAPPPGRRVG